MPSIIPGAPTIAAALAAAESAGSSGAVFVRAVIIGYEVSTRVGAAMARVHYRLRRNTGTIGTFGTELLHPGRRPASFVESLGPLDNGF